MEPMRREETRPGPTFRRMAAIYESQYLPRRAASTRAGQRSALRHALAHLPDHPSSGDWQTYINSRLADGEITETTARFYMKIYRAVYEWARNFFPMIQNPLLFLPKIKTPRLRPRGLADPRIYPALLEAMPDHRARLFLSCQRRLGLRFGETLAIEPRHILWGEGALRIEQSRGPRTARPGRLKADTAAATMPMHPEVIELLRLAQRETMAKKPHGWEVERFLFPYYLRHTADIMERCRAITPNDFPRRQVGQRGAAAFHVLRHTYGTELVEDAGLDLRDVQLLMRHQSAQTTQLYIASIRGRVIPEATLRSAWARLAEAEAAWTHPEALNIPGEPPVILPFAKRKDDRGARCHAED